MTELQFSNELIPLPRTLKIELFVQELQKKITNGVILYLIDRKEIGFFDKIEDIKTGLWKRLKPSDAFGHYFYDTEKDNEIIIFSDEASAKLGNFPLDRPTKKGFGFDPSKSLQNPIPPVIPQQQPVKNTQKSSNPTFNPYNNQQYPNFYNGPQQQFQQNKGIQQQGLQNQQMAQQQSPFYAGYNGFQPNNFQVTPQNNYNYPYNQQQGYPPQQQNQQMEQGYPFPMGQNFFNPMGGYIPMYNSNKNPNEQVMPNPTNPQVGKNMNPKQIEKQFII